MSRLEFKSSAFDLKLLSVSDVFIPWLRFNFPINTADSDKEHIFRLDCK